MILASRSESRQIDQLSAREFGLESGILMEAAGAVAAGEISRVFRRRLRTGAVAIVCGPGNNGGDGLVVARVLESAGVNVVVFLQAPAEKRSVLFQTQVMRAEKFGFEIVDLSRTPESMSRFNEMVLIVDALFGTGLAANEANDLRSPFRETIEAMNSAHSLRRIPIVSLDVPSGLDCDRGVACGLAVRATHTLSFGVAKPGFFVSEGPSHVGRLKVLAIGFPKKLVEREARTHTAFTLNMAKLSLPVRKPQTNKTHHGHAALFAGREGMWGAALLAASAAYRVGAGYVTLASFADARDVVREMPEILSGHLKDESFWRMPRWSVAAVGPGLGVGPETAEVIERLKTMNLKSVVLDADAITVAAREKLYPFPPEWILTPHAGELSRLSGASAKDIERDRYRYALEGARLCGCIVVLKGFRTIVSDGRVSSVVLSGNAALAKAGSGDVLTGLILGLLAQGLSSFRAAELAAFIHGSIADEWVREGKDPLSLQASDLAERLPWILARLRAEEASV